MEARDEKAHGALADRQDDENQSKTYKYPKQIGFIISNEFCERFNYYGMRTILVLYLTRKIHYDEDTATVVYHVFTSCVYFMCVFGALIADSWLGKFRTILYLSIVYVCGSATISIGAIPVDGMPAEVLTIVGLLLIAIGSGGIKPCVAAFGGDQFKLPEQMKQLGIFFSLFYFSINAGSLLSTMITPFLREIKCGENSSDCFSVAFGVPGILMLIAVAIFIVGKFMYVIKPPEGNMIVKVSQCIGNAIATRTKERKSSPREHWLDYAIPVHGKQLVEETKIVLKVLLLFIPLPIFWALFDQQGSRWTFQATRMDGSLSESFMIRPDQMQVVNPLLILIFIPLYDVAFYPLLAKIGIKRPLQKLTLGGIFAGISFLISAGLEMELEKTYPVIPKGTESHLRIFNGFECKGEINIPELNLSETIPSLDVFKYEYNNPKGEPFEIKFKSECSKEPTTPILATMFPGNSTSVFIYNNETIPGNTNYWDNPAKSTNGNPLIRILSTYKDVNLHHTYDNERTKFKNINEIKNLQSGNYDIALGDKKIGNIDLRLGGVYTLILGKEKENYTYNLLAISEPNSIHMLWIVPQYVVLTLGEVMFSVTGLEFSYSQAPANMKSVLQGGWQLAVGVGNLIVVIVAEVKAFDSQAYEFFLFAGLMMVDMLLFAFLAKQYKYVEPEKLAQFNEADTISDKRLSSSITENNNNKLEKSAFENPTFVND